jgi:hypothetical protein
MYFIYFLIYIYIYIYIGMDPLPGYRTVRTYIEYRFVKKCFCSEKRQLSSDVFMVKVTI